MSTLFPLLNCLLKIIPQGIKNVAYNKLQKIIPLRMQLTLVSAVQLNMLREN